MSEGVLDKLKIIAVAGYFAFAIASAAFAINEFYDEIIGFYRGLLPW